MLNEKTHLLFDLGYTLVYLNRERPYQLTLKRMGIEKSLKEIEMAFHYADKLFFREYPGVLGKENEVYYPWYIGVVNYYLNLYLDLMKVVTIHREVMEENPVYWQTFGTTKPALEMLKERGYTLGIISNWDLSARNVIEQNGMTDYFDEIIISAEVGVEKPDSRIFQLALEKFKVPSKQVLYIGDNYYDDIVGSSRLNMDSVLVNRFGRQGIEEIDHIVIENVMDLLQGHQKNNHEKGA